jgi:hypothetical protein
MIETNVKISLDSLKLWRKSIRSQLKQSQSGEITVAFKQWAVRYRAFAQDRFDRASKGDGTWPPLSARTIAGRRKGSSTILRDTGTLFAALAPTWSAPQGSINELIDGGVRVGFGGGSSHPSGFATIAEIASYHQVGGGRLPKREIIVQPTSSLMDAFAADLERALKNAE